MHHGRISDLSYSEDGDKPFPGCLTQDGPHIGDVGYQMPSPGTHKLPGNDHRLPMKDSTTEEDYQVPYSIPYNPLGYRPPAGRPREESPASHSSGGYHLRNTAPGEKGTEKSIAHSSGGRQPLNAAPVKKVTGGNMATRPNEIVELGDETDRSGNARRKFSGGMVR
ncbi:hypothetical protein Q9L58_009258 [Maublancomyces gigas]|uniref:Uncharacterized protein n=1 Tax=Discina gigas TaxID=1032678 RepID=A0ABR3G7D8_9PEZI